MDYIGIKLLTMILIASGVGSNVFSKIPASPKQVAVLLLVGERNLNVNDVDVRFDGADFEVFSTTVCCVDRVGRL